MPIPVAGRSQPVHCRLQHDGEWQAPQNLGCDINSPGGEASPSYFEDDSGNAFLYFSSNRSGGFEPDGVDSDIYFSLNFGPAQLAPGLNTASDDSRPNVSKDGREIVFDSTRPGTLGALPDIWTTKRESISDDWPTPDHLDAPINTTANETRATLSWDGSTMFFGSTRAGAEGSSDIYVTTRDKLKGNEH
jgi:Tol biopolymer transport system component